MLNSNQAPSTNSNDKINHFISQFKRIELYFRENTATRFMASIDTGIPIQNICRYVEDLEDLGLIAVVRKDKCQISGCMAEYLTTNPELFPKDNQLKLWE